jgi:glycosyltransferase involved in cell wall biosynthesis
MSMALRVAHVVLSMDVGGLERNVLNQIRQGPELGQRISVVCVERPGRLAAQAEALGTPVICLHKRPGIRPGMIRKMKSLFRELAPDVVHTHQIGTLFYAGPAARLARVPLVVHTEHGKENYAGRLETRLLGRIAGLFVQSFFCLTDDMASAVEQHKIVPKSKVHVIRNGIDVARYAQRYDVAATRLSLGIPLDAKVVGTVGRLNEVKQQDLLIRAFASVKMRNPCAHLLLVGDGPLMQSLRRLSDDLGISDCVHFAGYQSETAPYQQCMDVFALTSRSEGMPQAALEACVAGVPVVAPQVGGLPELVEHGRTGFLFPPGDQQSLVDALCELLAHPDRARDLGQAGQAQVEAMFDISTMAAEYHRHFLHRLGRANTLLAASGNKDSSSQLPASVSVPN